MVERGQSGQGSDLLSVEASQFGKFGQKRGAGDRADARHALNDLILGLPIVIGLHELGDFGIELGALLVQEGQELSDALAGELGGGLLEPIGFGGAEGDDLAAPDDKLL